MTIRVDGIRDAQAAFDRALRNVRVATPNSIKDITLDLLGKSVELAPIDTGDLRGSGKATFSEGGMAGEVSFATPYALRVHEDMEANHPRGGIAKYLEVPFVGNTPRYVRMITESVRGAMD